MITNHTNKENKIKISLGIRRTIIPGEYNLLNLLDMRLSRGKGKCRKWVADLFEVSEERKGRNRNKSMVCPKCFLELGYQKSLYLVGGLFHYYFCRNKKCMVDTVSVKNRSNKDIDVSTREQMEKGLPDIGKFNEERGEKNEN